MLSLSHNLYIFSSLLFVMMTVVLFAIEKWSIAFKSIFILATLLLFFSIFPIYDDNGLNKLSPSIILNGFSNTSLISVVCLLILGQGVVQTRVLDSFISRLLELSPRKHDIIFIFSLIFVLVLSSFLNNTPVVIIFIPIFQSIASKVGSPISKYMMPLSFASILGGMTTLIGSSTNLLVANSLNEYSGIQLSFFEFIIPGSIIAIVGIIYILIFSRYLLKDNSPMANELIGSSGKQFVAQITIPKDSILINQQPKAGTFKDLENVTILMIQRKEHAEFAPYDNLTLQEGDLLVIATSRESLSEILTNNNGISIAQLSDLKNEEIIENENENRQILSEAMVTPSSSLVGQTIENASFRYRYDSVVIGLQRRSRMIRNRMTEIPLEPGDVLLIQGSKESIKNLRVHSDIMPMEWASTEIYKRDSANKSLIIFLAVIFLSALEFLPLVVSSLLGVFTMLFSRILTIKQAFRAIDKNLVLLIVTALALGNIIQITGAATYLSEFLFDILKDSSPTVILTSFFIFVSLATNFISNNACAVLFTPIALDLASKVNIDPKVFAISVIFAVNTSFLTPMAYQTNLLVMGPGHYKFIDFLKFGFPLTIICWITFSLYFPWFYGL